MNEEYRRLMTVADEPKRYEFPSGFDYDVLEKAAKIVDAKIQSILRETTKFEGAVYNQDASFSIAILLTDGQKQTASGVLTPTIRFSNFGHLVSMTGSCQAGHGTQLKMFSHLPVQGW